jgi:hypothetical protein
MVQRQLFGVRDAARQLAEMGHTVSASTISRQIGKLYPNHGTADRPLVDLAEVIDARQNRLDPDRRRAGLKARGILALDTLPPEDTDALAQSLRPTGGDLGDARLRKEAAKAGMAELDLAERQKEVAPVRDFKDGGYDLGRLVRDEHAARLPALLAAAKEHAGNDRALTAAIEQMDRAVEEALAKSVEKLLNGKGDEQPA